MKRLICKRVLFYSENDEVLFSEWITRIKGIGRFFGQGDEIILEIRRNISRTSLQEITALFFRYKIEMEQLKTIVTEKNREWYSESTKYWHRQVFGKKRQEKTT